MSGVEFDLPALVRIFNNTDLGIVRDALIVVGLGDEREMETAVRVLLELDEEIRLLRRYRVTQENANISIVDAASAIAIEIVDLLSALADLFIDPLGAPRRMRAAVDRIHDFVNEIARANEVSAKATRLAAAKLDELIETRGKIALVLNEPS